MAGEFYTYQTPVDCFPEAEIIANYAIQLSQSDNRKETNPGDYHGAEECLFWHLVKSSNEFVNTYVIAGQPPISTVAFNKFLTK